MEPLFALGAFAVMFVMFVLLPTKLMKRGEEAE